jgi:hypothetical protein
MGSVWNRPSICSPRLRDSTNIKWEINKTNKYDNLFVCNKIEDAIYWAYAACEEYKDVSLIIIEVEHNGGYKEGEQLSCTEITPTRIVSTQEYFHLLPTNKRYFTKLVSSLGNVCITT